MSTEAMRQELLLYYRGSNRWGNKVRKMTDAQVVAIYKRLVNEKKQER